MGCHVAEADITALLEAATLLYGGSFVAERHAAVGEHIAAHEDLIGDTLDPVVATIIADGAKHSASSYFADRERLDHLAAQAATALAGFDALLTPTTTGHPTLEEVRADPVGANARLGRYTNFCNLLDLAALAVPAGTAASGPFGIMLTGPAGSDDRLASLAALHDPPSTELLVVGAHLSGQPLNRELLLAGGVLLGPVSTAPQYRLYALDTVPPKPGLVRVPAPAASGPRGAAIAGELWQLQATGLARFMAGLGPHGDRARPPCRRAGGTRIPVRIGRPRRRRRHHGLRRLAGVPGAGLTADGHHPSVGTAVWSAIIAGVAEARSPGEGEQRRRAGRPRLRPATNAGVAPRAEILNAAAELFVRQGLAATTTRQIADRVGIRQASLYYHFAGKDEILLELLTQSVRPSLRVAATLEARCVGDPAAGLYALVLIDAATLTSAPHNIATFYLLPEVQGEEYASFHAERAELPGSLRTPRVRGRGR